MSDLWVGVIPAIVVVLIIQIYVSVQLYRYEQSKWWGLLGVILFFGLNVYVYQIVKLEQKAGYSFSKLTLQERGDWRKVYLAVCAQYLIMFALFQWMFYFV